MESIQKRVERDFQRTKVKYLKYKSDLAEIELALNLKTSDDSDYLKKKKNTLNHNLKAVEKRLKQCHNKINEIYEDKAKASTQALSKKR